jgi:hypothetical protein
MAFFLSKLQAFNELCQWKVGRSIGLGAKRGVPSVLSLKLTLERKKGGPASN